MSLELRKEIVNDEEISIESIKYPNFVGFLSPKGVPIEFEDKLNYTCHGEILSFPEKFRVFYPLKIKKSPLISPLEEYIMTDEYLRREKESNLERLLELRQTDYENLEDKRTSLLQKNWK